MKLHEWINTGIRSSIPYLKEKATRHTCDRCGLEMLVSDFDLSLCKKDSDFIHEVAKHRFKIEMQDCDLYIIRDVME